MRCEICFFCVEQSCRRYPPTVPCVEKGSKFLNVFEDDWCGEFLYRNSAQATRLKRLAEGYKKKEEARTASTSS